MVLLRIPRIPRTRRSDRTSGLPACPPDTSNPSHLLIRSHFGPPGLASGRLESFAPADQIAFRTTLGGTGGGGTRRGRFDPTRCPLWAPAGVTDNQLEVTPSESLTRARARKTLAPASQSAQNERLACAPRLRQVGAKSASSRRQVGAKSAPSRRRACRRRTGFCGCRRRKLSGE